MPLSFKVSAPKLTKTLLRIQTVLIVAGCYDSAACSNDQVADWGGGAPVRKDYHKKHAPH